jgi:ATP-dependent DNA helicase RecG
MAIVATLSDSARVRRVFELELQRGCTNQTVVGGLDRMLIQMEEDGHMAIGGELRRMVSELPAGGYNALTPERRQEWLENAVRSLAREEAAAASRGPRPITRPEAAIVERQPVKGGHATKPPVRAKAAAPVSAAPTRIPLDAPIERLPGIGKAGAQRFEKLGVKTAADAVYFFPRRFNDFTDIKPIAELQPGRERQTVVARVSMVREMRYGRRVKGAEALLRDGSGALRAAWFNMPYVARNLAEGDMVVVSGKVRSFRGRLQMENPEFEPYDADISSAGRLVPVYPATQGLSQRVIRRAVGFAVEFLAGSIPDPVPEAIRNRDQLSPMVDAIRSLHYPGTFVEAEEARRRLAIGEFLAIQCAVLMRRAEWQQGQDAPPLELGETLDAFTASLPFALTRAQANCLDEILVDLRTQIPMLRLLQGDVGSGKTVVAVAAMVAAVRSGHQAALMAPTEILAEQHYRSLTRMLGGDSVSALDGVFVPPWLGRPVRLLMLTGSLTPAQKAQVRSDAAHGGADLIIGTHALLEDNVQLPRLGLAVVDEQHRFGVSQRQKLRQKGNNPHLLVMTATPIPRTLALTVYGDLEVSTIDEMPPGRKPVKTVWVAPHERDDAYAFIREHLDTGEQAFVICPLVEDSETLDLRSAEEEFERLKAGPLSRYRLDLLHGRMGGRQKDEIMGRFAAREADVLVSTSVIEVGIDVPNATVMIIEGAERFGLSQLHQFRGRVGRSPIQSYCMLFSTEEDPGPDARERLEAMVETTDGFRLAEVDLEMRGEGEAWGTIQSGANSMLRVARLTDRDLLYRARHLAEEILERDPKLQLAENRALAAMVKPFLERATEAN